MNFERARDFVHRNARPLELARWNYLFGQGSREAVLTALSAYQNGDGGFGHALEADCWNPNSSPIQTWAATEIVREVGLEDRNHPIIEGILRYLASGREFDGHTWGNTVPSNNEYPHAPWWEDVPEKETSYNPTASLLGFILKYADPAGELYRMACGLVQEALGYLRRSFPTQSVGTVSSFVELYGYLTECAPCGLADLDAFRELLHRQIRHVITYDTSTWNVEYVCRPSFFIRSKASDFYQENAEICQYEREFAERAQNADGTWNITWSWEDYAEEWYISKNWWKSNWIIKNVHFINEMKA